MIGIDPDKTVSTIMDPKKLTNQQKTGKNEFQNFFQQAVNSAKTESTAVASAPYVPEIRPVQFDTRIEPSTSMIVDQVSHLMNTMEAYQRRLMESDATLKDIEPIVEKIAKQSESLAAIVKDAKMDDDLKTIVNQSLSLSSKEITQYRSGHYNNE